MSANPIVRAGIAVSAGVSVCCILDKVFGTGMFDEVKERVTSIRNWWIRSLTPNIAPVASIAPPARLFPLCDLAEAMPQRDGLWEETTSFDLYRDPNEGGVKEIIPHLEMTKPSLLVSAGTERSFWDLILLDQKYPDQCQGLVVRDISPKAVAYVNFVIILLLCAKNREELQKFAQPTDNLEEHIQTIRSLLASVSYSPRMKAFYEKNLESFAKSYFEASHRWRTEAFFPVNYFNNEEEFQILKKYADQGKMIATLGDIGDLQFLEDAGHKIGIVDTSNIHDYALIRPKWKESKPKIISTYQDYRQTIYESTSYQPLSAEQEKQLDEWMSNPVICDAIQKYPRFSYASSDYLQGVQSLIDRYLLDCGDVLIWLDAHGETEYSLTSALQKATKDNGLVLRIAQKIKEDQIEIVFKDSIYLACFSFTTKDASIQPYLDLLRQLPNGPQRFKDWTKNSVLTQNPEFVRLFGSLLSCPEA